MPHWPPALSHCLAPPPRHRHDHFYMTLHVGGQKVYCMITLIVVVVVQSLLVSNLDCNIRLYMASPQTNSTVSTGAVISGSEYQ